MKEVKKSRRSQRSKHLLRLLLALLPLPLTLSLSLFPELAGTDRVSLTPLLLVFAFGALVGTVTHIYWLRVLLKEQRFYQEFYEEHAVRPQKVDKEMSIKHTRLLLPFYVFGVLMFFLIVFVFGLFDLDMAYLLPLVFGALEGVPISYYMMEKGVVS